MKSFKLTMAIAVLTAVCVFGATQVRADYLFYYNFDNPNISAPLGGATISGQDGWSMVPFTTPVASKGEAHVYPSAPGYDGNVVGRYLGTYDKYSARHYFEPGQSWHTFSASDTIELQMRMYAGDDVQCMGLNFEGQPLTSGYAWVGYTGTWSGQPNYTLRFYPWGGSSAVLGASITKERWYDVKAVIDFSPIDSQQSPTISFLYRDLGTTLDGSEPAMSDPTDYLIGGITNQAIWLGTKPTVYRADYFGLINQRPSSGSQTITTFVSEVGVWAVPEPSTLALLGAGLLGLLACAWRKRR